MKKLITTGLLTSMTLFLFAQDINTIINAKEVERIETILSSDAMQGRRVFTPGIEKAEAFIENEFSNIGLQKLNNSDSYLQNFTMIKPKFISVNATINQQSFDPKSVIVVTSKTDLSINETSGFEKVFIKAGSNLIMEAMKYTEAQKNYLVVVDTSFAKNFSRLIYFKRSIFKSDVSVVFVLSNINPATYSINAKHEITESTLSNIVGVIPGKSLKNEYVIFSGHYDHLGVGSPREGYPHDNKDSIYNGANDDAAGTTAVITLARYFKALNNNERTLIFVAFTAEEIGEYGSQYFAKQFDPGQVKAMFNIEMIGTESKWGRGSAYITGFDKTDMGKILQQNLEGSSFQFYADPYTDQHLFYRSDNASLARVGVPAHTISTSKMDNELNYHKVTDEIGTLDMNNMAEIIKAIAISSKTIISGKDTPTRVDAATLD
ncbi:MAG: M20/M25/M40 family metallo-hydrolase [Bacteroidota bacterium]|nr:M20/M25/M40 family metallo-hydrolase [Bacteroidota bacterium]